MKWISLKSEYVFEAPYVKIRKDHCEIPSKGKIDFFTVEIPDWAAVVAFSNKKIVLVKQYRHPVGQEMIELPAGFLKSSEKPEAAVRREFSEEIGFELVKIQKIGEWATMAGKGTNKAIFFLAHVGQKTKRSLEKEEKGLEILYKTPKQVLSMIREGEIWSAPYIAAILAAKEKNPALFEK